MVCTNLNRKGRRLRLLSGALALAAGIIGWYLTRDGKAISWKLVIALLVFFGWLCLLQVARGTCVVLAAKNQRETDGTAEIVQDSALSTALRMRALQVMALTVLATGVTLGLMWIPMGS